MLNVGVLGAGAIAPPYYMALSARPQLKLACASKGMASAEAPAPKLGIRAVTPETLIDDEALDVILIESSGEELLDARTLF